MIAEPTLPTYMNFQMRKRGVKREKRINFCKVNMQDHCFSHTYIYMDNKNIYKFIKNVQWEKLCLHLFNKKISLYICWTRLKTTKLFATAKQLIRKNSVCCLKNQVIFFSQSAQTDWLDHPLPLFCFCSLFKDPLSPPQRPYFLKGPTHIGGNLTVWLSEKQGCFPVSS